jgi:hypothetical protein
MDRAVISSSSTSTVPPSSILSASQSKKKPSQIKFYRPAQMALFAHIVTYPPLAQVTIVAPSRKQVRLLGLFMRDIPLPILLQKRHIKSTPRPNLTHVPPIIPHSLMHNISSISPSS